VSAIADSGNSVCSNPLKTICTDTIIQRQERKAFVTNLKKVISEEALINAVPRIEKMKKKISRIRFIKRFLETIKINNQEVMKSAKMRIGGFEEVVTSQENVSKIKSYMYESIDTSSFNEETKVKFKSIIKSIVVGNFSDFLEKSDLENNVFDQIIGNACGSDGLVENAFATDLKGERYVLICPGFLITLSQTASATDRFNSILQAITHEMGHHIDNQKVGNELYAPYLSCLAKNYSDKFNKSAEDTKFCSKKKTDKEKCNKKVVLSHAGELIADQWGIRASVIRAQKELYSSADTDLMLTNSWANICATSEGLNHGDEGIHPSGNFRIDLLMGKNPGINEYLGCLNNETALKPACTFTGENF
jgi:hypothetical protein